MRPGKAKNDDFVRWESIGIIKLANKSSAYVGGEASATTARFRTIQICLNDLPATLWLNQAVFAN
jgi:hypothetical protein